MDATLIARSPRGSGEEIVLDRTVFYATSGGQAHDTGEISGARVVDVQKKDQAIVHVTDRPLPSAFVPGARVHGKIDADRRLDHLRQHHGQHLLSAAFAKTVGAATAAVHFGARESTLDLDQLVSESDITKAVELTNKIIMEDREVKTHLVSREEIVKFNLRREPGVEAQILRIIEVDGFDTTPCSGTHPKRTGQVGPVAVVGTEKVRGGTRLTFLCGERALADAAAKNIIIATLAKDFSVTSSNIIDSILKLKNAEGESRKRARLLFERVAALDAARLVSESPNSAVVTCEAAAAEAGEGGEGLGVLAAKIVDLGKGAIVGCVIDGRAQLLVAVPKTLQMNAGLALKAALPLLDGKGGGNVTFARGSGGNVEGLRAAIAKAAEVLASGTSTGGPSVGM